MVVRLLGWVFVAVLVAAGGLAGGVWLFLNESVTAIRASSPEVRETQAFLDLPTPGAPATAIIIGYDKRKGPEAELTGRSDTVMLVRTDPKDETISLLSFPRDLIVDIPACRGQGPWRTRINEAYTLCGPKGTLRTVKQLTGIPINYVITVNFHAFKQIVDKVGGVYMDVDRRYFNDNSGFGANYAVIDLHPGYQRLSGSQALDYVRFRHADSDIYRIGRQQAFVKAFKQQVQGFSSLTALPGIVEAITDNVEVGVGGGKDIDLKTVFGYAKLAYELPGGNFFQARIDGVSGYSELSAADGSIATAVRDFVNPDTRAAEKATRSATGKKVRPDAPQPASVTVEVLNGNGIDGHADEAAFQLGQRGYRSLSGGDADRYDYFRTRVIYDPAVKGAEAAAGELADLFGVAEVAEATPESPLAPISTMVRVIVGQTFKGTIAPGPTDRTPEHEKPSIVKDYASVLPLLKREQSKVDFPLLVPTIREQTSSLDSQESLRRYRVKGHDAVRLVYRTGGLRFWGIQQTSWTEAPALGGASVERKLGPRTFKLYYSGARLHMVAFEEQGAVYWVSNSILDELSNETMLAIAKGLKPLRSVR